MVINMGELWKADWASGLHSNLESHCEAASLLWLPRGPQHQGSFKMIWISWKYSAKILLCGFFQKFLPSRCLWITKVKTGQSHWLLAYLQISCSSSDSQTKQRSSLGIRGQEQLLGSPTTNGKPIHTCEILGKCMWRISAIYTHGCISPSFGYAR